LTWRLARTRIAAILAAIEITDPTDANILRVYETPPATVEDAPCFVILPPALKLERAGGGLRIKTYTVRMRCLVADEAVDRAADLVDAFREAVVDAFDVDLTLAGTATHIAGPDVEEARGWLYSGREFVGMDFLLTVTIKEARAFA